MKTIKALLTVASLLGSSFAFAEPAVIIVGNDCSMIDGNGDSFITNDTKVVQTNSRKGVINKKCYASGVPNETGRAVHWNSGNTGGLMCAVLEGLTDDWKLVVDDEGNAQLTCKIRSN